MKQSDIQLSTFFTFFLALLIFCACQPNELSRQDLTSGLKKHTIFLASDELEGRETGSRGAEEAARYIAQQFEASHLTPGGTNGYLQAFDVTPSMNPHEKPEMNADGDSLTIKALNVVGMIDNPGDQVIVIGAHYDHLGYGGFGSLHRGDTLIHNGADDNASGVAVLLMLAEKLKSKKLNQDIMFIAFSGEEKGLWGSNYFVKNPTIELKNIKAMINMDMVGRLNEERSLVVHGTGTSPVWEQLLGAHNTDNLSLIMKPSGMGPSDHTSFYLQDIPVLHFFTGQHEDYHKPTDDVDKLNYEGMTDIAEYITRITISLDSASKMEFTKTKDESQDTPRFKVTLGVIPDYLYDGKGMRIDGVSEGKPASKAGLQKGDVVVKLGGENVEDMMSYMKALSRFNEGDTTTVVVKRGEEQLNYSIEF
ncbi:Putative aminopeptidase [Fulvivirga imtechensis AK7]|uniref:Putative aminopeptidase n=1 Tax=Fulvivirga imtechensis AK7 TaxID=1237149 RepID=L8JS96_9BACT|nr:M20/M25/M40 family metallo-hydrolase [Fulvivirga imtechensis]ELR71088.1 Putative aminopeptidase [Fulvivirga imtechensis AK7]